VHSLKNLELVQTLSLQSHGRQCLLQCQKQPSWLISLHESCSIGCRTHSAASADPKPKEVTADLCQQLCLKTGDIRQLFAELQRSSLAAPGQPSALLQQVCTLAAAGVNLPPGYISEWHASCLKASHVCFAGCCSKAPCRCPLSAGAAVGCWVEQPSTSNHLCPCS
jgi:hypothetical protein